MWQAVAPVIAYVCAALVIDTRNKRQWEVDKCKRVASNLTLQLVLARIVGDIGVSHRDDDEWSRMIARCVVALLTLDLAFASTHRLFHVIPMLWRMHKDHHSVAPPSMSGYEAQFCHPVEHVACNLVPAAIAAWASGLSHAGTTVFFCFAECNSVWAHADTRSYHALHHLEPWKHFGLGGMLSDRFERYPFQ